MKRMVYLLAIGAILVTLACGGGGGGGGGGTSTDTIPPTIGSLSVSPNLLTLNTPAQITATVTDLSSGVQAVQALLTYPDNTQVSTNLTLSTGNTYQATFNAQWDGSAGNLIVRLQAVDRAGNTATREAQVRLVGSPPPPPF